MAKKDGQIFGSKHGYVIPGAQAQQAEEVQLSKQVPDAEAKPAQQAQAKEKKPEKKDKSKDKKYKVKF